MAILIAAPGFIYISNEPAFAATTFTVNSVGDGSDSDPGDGVCEVSDGECTFRAALEESNALAGTDTIEFEIGPSDGNVKTIEPSTRYPDIVDQVFINGYSQDDATPNTAVSPNPLNGKLLIELDGNNDSNNSDGLFFGAGSEGSQVRGLIINSFYNGIQMFASNITIQGNYIGTDATGLVDKGNDWAGINHTGVGEGTDALVGGLDPEDRNLISGNTSSAGYPAARWTIQGNYVGVDATGLTALGNSSPGEAGAFSVDYAEDVLIGGTATGATNVISGNFNQGLAPFYADRLIIQGNLIGTDYTGMVAIPNGSIGINLNHSVDVLIGGNTSAARNVVSGNINNDGMCVGDNTNLQIKGNYIGVAIDGATPLGNGGSGVTTGCGATGTGIIGGSSSGEGNIIANNSSSGISVVRSTDVFSIVGNSIYSNASIGIDLGADSFTYNDDGDVDSGSNDLLNFPVVENVVDDGSDLTIDYTVDVPSGSYRVEFFSNYSEDLGYWEGETLLGSYNITHPGGEQAYVHTLSGAAGETGITMSITEIDNSTFSGFGSTSEFSMVIAEGYAVDINVDKTLLNPDDVEIGAEIEYRFDIINDGDISLDLEYYAGTSISDTLVIDVLPPDLNLISSNDPNVICNSQGENSGAMLGPDFSDYEIILCGWAGDPYELSGGDAYTFVLTMEVAGSSDLQFTNFAVMPPSPIDPDAPVMLAIFAGQISFQDAIEAGDVGNIAAAVYPAPLEEPEPTTTTTTLPNANSNVGNKNATGTLPLTGRGVPAVTAAVVLIGFGLFLVNKKRAIKHL